MTASSEKKRRNVAKAPESAGFTRDFTFHLSIQPGCVRVDVDSIFYSVDTFHRKLRGHAPLAARYA